MTAPSATGRWRGVVAVSLFAGAVGLLAQRPDVLLLAALGVGFAAYPRLVPPSPEPDLAVERTTAPDSPAEGDRVDVTVTVRNEGDRSLPDLRVVDGVPSLLPVVDGTPRHATALPPGGEATFRYSVEARPGKHRFEPATVVSRDASGATELRTAAAHPTVVDCGAPVPAAALRELTRNRPGELVTDDGGSGIEFHRTREYRPGDPMNRVDWRRFARTGELATVEYREERSASVVLCLDVGSPPAAGASGPDAPDGRSGSTDPASGSDVDPTADVDARSNPHALARGVLAADRLASALEAANHEVGLATLGDRHCWIPPSGGTAHLDRLRHALDTHPAFGTADGPGDGSSPGGPGRAGRNGWPTGENAGRTGGVDGNRSGDRGSDEEASPARLPDGVATLSDGGRRDGTARGARGRQAAELRERLDPGTQVTLVSPLADDGVLGAVRSLEAAGHPVYVVSPDTTAPETVGTRLAGVERSRRLRTLRRTGVPVVDWAAGEDLRTALAAAAGGSA
ncbi:DUF58 domain-containing protein [Halorarum salinum]|uniref:DUF58 domain-containing protein n=1 Tax=Halorarum salinum TaxID=2743089 RepID=A0A7D5QFN7_9EURY|nr:DUF58 domain-containing protein [Halobaculum salinum]QLG63601.1 DUF58 domain-containing protein [Halobaculum salinum]